MLFLVLWLCLDGGCLLLLQGLDVLFQSTDLLSVFVDGEIDGGLMAFTGLQCWDTPEFAFNATVVGEVGAGLQSGDITFALGIGVFP